MLTLVFGLPGNPVSCMVTFDLFVAPTLAHLSGARSAPRRSVPARLARNLVLGWRREGALLASFDWLYSEGVKRDL